MTQSKLTRRSRAGEARSVRRVRQSIKAYLCGQIDKLVGLVPHLNELSSLISGRGITLISIQVRLLKAPNRFTRLPKTCMTREKNQNKRKRDNKKKKRRNKAGYTAQDAPSKRLKITRDRRTYGPTDLRTDGHTLI